MDNKLILTSVEGKDNAVCIAGTCTGKFLLDAILALTNALFSQLSTGERVVCGYYLTKMLASLVHNDDCVSVTGVTVVKER